jgi:hypothetical protein
LLFLSAGLLLVQPCAGGSGSFENTGSLVTARYQHTDILLPNGKVLVAGNSFHNLSAELYDNATGTWAATGGLGVPVWGFTLALLPNGKVLAAGGVFLSGDAVISYAGAELYDPASEAWTATGSITFARQGHTGTVLFNGLVLVAGGFDRGNTLASAEVYDPASGAWTSTSSLGDARYLHTALLLPNGQVLVAGGYHLGAIASAELYDPASKTWKTTGSLTTARYNHRAVLLPNGKVLVAGGVNSNDAIASAELYDPVSETWTPTASLIDTRGEAFTATLLPNGKVLVVAGFTFLGSGGASLLSSAELYDPAKGTWTPTDSVAIAEEYHSATLLPNGQVLIAGGYGGEPVHVPLASAELYRPETAATPTPTPTPSPIPGTSLTPGTHDFGSVAAGSSSSPFVFTVHNNQGAPALGLTYTLSGTDEASFAITSNNCGSTLGVGMSCELSVTFSPITVGPKAASLTVTGSNSGTHSASLTGLGTPPTSSPTPTPTSTPTPTPASPTPTPTPSATPAAQAVNLSTRLLVQTGNNVGIGGFIITGNAPKEVLLRAIGPSLAGSGVPNALADPVMELHGPGAFVTIINHNWRDTQATEIIATGIPPTNDLESAILATLDPGAYTAIVKGEGNSTGVGLVEIYDLNPAAASKLANISTRGFVDTGDNTMIGGLIIGDGGAARIYLRVLGPSLPVPGALGDPTLELRDGSGTLVAFNDNWKLRPDGSSQQAEIEATGIPPTNDLESALFQTLPAGSYTAIVRGKNNTSGAALLEFYDLQ